MVAKPTVPPITLIGRCKNVTGLTQLEIGREYYLADGGIFYYVFKDPKFGHTGGFAKGHFDITGTYNPKDGKTPVAAGYEPPKKHKQKSSKPKKAKQNTLF